LRGIIALLISQALFVTSDSVVKLAGEMLPVTQIMALRGLLALTIAGAVVVSTVDLNRWHNVFRPLVVLRATIEAVLAAMFLVALPHMPLGDITVINQITPLVVTMLSALLLGEIVGWRRWSAIAVGFVGVVLVAQPTADGISIYALLAVLVAILVAVRDIVTRRLDHAIPTATVTFTSTLSVCALGFAGSPLEVWQPLSWQAIALLSTSALLITLANGFIIRAFRGVDMSVVAPFRYFAVVWALALGFAIWTEIPNALAIGGTLLIVVSGLYTMHRETLKMRRPS
jgi:drug/metabolite transporter (DMT)-like permease